MSSSPLFVLVTILLAVQALAFVPASKPALHTSLNFNMGGQMNTEQGKIAGIGGMAGPSAPSARPQKNKSGAKGAARPAAFKKASKGASGGGLKDLFNKLSN